MQSAYFTMRILCRFTALFISTTTILKVIWVNKVCPPDRQRAHRLLMAPAKSAYKRAHHQQSMFDISMLFSTKSAQVWLCDENGRIFGKSYSNVNDGGGGRLYIVRARCVFFRKYVRYVRRRVFPFLGSCI